MADFSIKIEGLSQLEKIPGGLETAQRQFLGKVVDKLADAIGDAAPKRSGKLASSFKGTTISSTRGMIKSDLIYAKAQDQGAYIVAKGKTLRFPGNGRDGNSYPRFVRLQAQNYVKKGLRKRNSIAAQVYEQEFGDLGI